MKAITLWQPWASLIALGEKTIETRSWSTKYRGPLAIHAGLRCQARPLGGFTVEDDTPRRSAKQFLMRGESLSWPYRLPLGVVVATCELVDVVPMIDADEPPVEFQCSPPGRKYLSNWETGRMLLISWPVYNEIRCVGSTTEEVTDQLPYGDYSPGRFAWLLENIQPTDPVAAKGHQGLWDWSDVPGGGVL